MLGAIHGVVDDETPLTGVLAAYIGRSSTNGDLRVSCEPKASGVQCPGEGLPYCTLRGSEFRSLMLLNYNEGGDEWLKNVYDGGGDDGGDKTEGPFHRNNDGVAGVVY